MYDGDDDLAGASGTGWSAGQETRDRTDSNAMDVARTPLQVKKPLSPPNAPEREAIRLRKELADLNQQIATQQAEVDTLNKEAWSYESGKPHPDLAPGSVFIPTDANVRGSMLAGVYNVVSTKEAELTRLKTERTQKETALEAAEKEAKKRKRGNTSNIKIFLINTPFDSPCGL